MTTRTIVHSLTGLVVLIVSSYAIEASLPNETRRIPEIKQGEKCVKGQVYKMDCNTCHCGAQSNLLCTKMACINNIKTGGNLRSKNRTCSAGKLYKKGCQKCYCTEKKRLKCSQNNCDLAERTYVNPEHIHPMNPEDFYKLPSVPHQGEECKPGVTYRIDCNTCFCLETKNLMCQKMLCPSYEDFYRLKAKELSGKPCNASMPQDCLECQCKDGKLECESKPACRHADGRRMMHGEFPSDRYRNFIDVNNITEQCKSGMVYKVHCNKCYCQDDGSMRCTQKTCLNYTEVQRLQKLKAKLNEENTSDCEDDE